MIRDRIPASKILSQHYSACCEGRRSPGYQTENYESGDRQQWAEHHSHSGRIFDN
ncbi:MAG TPA: hypothetical protein IGS40_17945 [Trichormus sp. M33_DOE_039]|nr:hypothetical protein [Trichormus sp. M33_DOE_039]